MWGHPEERVPAWASDTQFHICPQEPWMEASASASLMASTLPLDTSST